MMRAKKLWVPPCALSPLRLPGALALTRGLCAVVCPAHHRQDCSRLVSAVGRLRSARREAEVPQEQERTHLQQVSWPYSRHSRDMQCCR